jgi:hypothetical protein
LTFLEAISAINVEVEKNKVSNGRGKVQQTHYMPGQALRVPGV